MTNLESRTEARAPLSAEAAFVVHLTGSQLDVPEDLRGRVEHVRSGQSLRFGSVADLVTFMQQMLADTDENRVPSEHQPQTLREVETP